MNPSKFYKSIRRNKNTNKQSLQSYIAFYIVILSFDHEISNKWYILSFAHTITSQTGTHISGINGQCSQLPATNNYYNNESNTKILPEFEDDYIDTLPGIEAVFQNTETECDTLRSNEDIYNNFIHFELKR